MLSYLLYITWDVAPEIFSLGSFELRWYGLGWVLAFFLGYLLMSRMYKEEGISVEELDSLSMYVILGAVIGARLGHVIFYQPDYYLENPAEILMVWKGGLASHGGAIGMLIGIWLYHKKGNPKTFLWVLDRLALVIPLGGMWIRLGNLMNSEILGTATDKSWAFLFVRAEQDPVPRHPAQLYEALAYLVIFLIVAGLYHTRRRKVGEGMFIGIALTLIFLARFLIEFVKQSQVEFEDAMAYNMGQLLSIPFMIFGIFLIIRALRARKGTAEAAGNKHS